MYFIIKCIVWPDYHVTKVSKTRAKFHESGANKMSYHYQGWGGVKFSVNNLDDRIGEDYGDVF